MPTEQPGRGTSTLLGTLVEVPGAYLERNSEPGGRPERVSIRAVPLTIGRAETADHTIYATSVSNTHAAVIRRGDHYAVQDLQSTNGTFVNGQRVAEQILADGDIIHFAKVEFCFREPRPGVAVVAGYGDGGINGTQALPLALPVSRIRGTEMLRDLIRREALEVLFQPIVDLNTSEVIGLEALGRGTHPELGRSPVVLLQLADHCGMAIELSQLFRRLAVESCSRLPGRTKLFLNVHPRELADVALVESIAALGRQAQLHPIVIEIPESAVTDVAMIQRTQEALRGSNVEVAYDDFGTGQARLLDMTNAPPHYLKFDKTLIQGLEAAKPRQEMLSALFRAAKALGIRVIAEGIEKPETAQACRELGCHLGQGYLLCPPIAAGQKLKHRK